MAGVQGFEP